MIKIRFIIFLVVWGVLLVGCTSEYDPNAYFTTKEDKEVILGQLLPYVLPKPEDIAVDARFEDSVQNIYQRKAELDSVMLKYYFVNENSQRHYFMVIRKDRRSLFQDYRAVCGTFLRNENRIQDVDLIFSSNMLKKDILETKSLELFQLALAGQDSLLTSPPYKSLIEWPNADVTYNKEKKMWDLNPNSEWANVLREIKK